MKHQRDDDTVRPLVMPCIYRAQIVFVRRFHRQAVAGDGAVVVEPQQLDHVTDVRLAFDFPRRRPLRIGEHRVGHDPALL